MQFDFKCELTKTLVKCKYRDVIITNKNCLNFVELDDIKNNFVQILPNNNCVINYYSDNLRYYSFGFIKHICALRKLLHIMYIML